MLIDADGTVWLLDFGIAGRLDSETQADVSTDRLEGSLAYMSPEQTGRVNRSIDARTDFYSLGATLYEALTGGLPFPERDPGEIVHGHVAREPTPPSQLRPELPSFLDLIVRKLMAKAAERRYQSGLGLARDLERCLTELRAHGRIEPFALGRSDRPDRFLIPKRLYGRDRELEVLTQCFERATAGAQELCLVFGYSGIGKTALVHELHRSIVERHGSAVEGKFDQFKRNIPYASVIQAFRTLVGRILTESSSRVEEWRTRLQSALGGLGRVVTDVIPEVELVLGTQPPVPELEPDAARNRFNRALVAFVGTFARSDHPLVLFFDDLQWADQGSLDLLRRLVTDPDIGHLLVIGSYRDNEIDASHPLTVELAHLRRERELAHGERAIVEVHLGGLGAQEVRALVADTTLRESEAIAPLATLVHDKTAGNPFFVHQFLGHLHRSGLLRLDDATGWVFDLEAIRREAITDNVVELLVGKIRAFGERSQRALSIAACMGTTFDFQTLARLLNRDWSELSDDLWQALDAGLVLPLDTDYDLAALTAIGERAGINPRYQFHHDRVQQAAYQLLDDDERRQTHRNIAWTLWRDAAPDERDDRLFDVADHLGHALEVLTAADESIEAATVLVQAGARAKQAAAFGPAVRYLTAARTLLGSELYGAHYDLGATAMFDLASCQYLSSQIDSADGLFAELRTHVRTDAERARSFVLRVQLRIGRGQVLEALQLAQEGLAFCGEALDLAPDQAAIGAAFGDLGAAIDGRTFDALAELHEATDPLKVAALEILNDTAAPAYYVNENLYALIILKMCTLSARHGQSGVSPFGWALYGVLMGPILGDFATSTQTARLARRIQARFDRVQMVPKVSLCLDGFVDHWTQPPLSCIPRLVHGARIGVEAGDPVFAAYCTLSIGYLWLMTGKERADLIDESQEWFAYCERLGIAEAPEVHAVNVRLGRALGGETPSVTSLGADEDAWLARLEGFVLKIPLHMALLAKMELCVVHDDLIAGAALIARSAALEPRSLGTGHQSVHPWLTALLLARRLDGMADDDPDRSGVSEAFEAQRTRIAAWAVANPMSFDHKRLALDGIAHEHAGRALEALASYDAAIASADAGGFTKNLAIVCERVARLFERRGHPRVFESYLREARAAYEHWGASAKVAALEARSPWLRSRLRYAVRGSSSSTVTATPTLTASLTTTSSPQAIDLWSLLKASHAIAGEIVLERLTETLMGILLENTGAQRATLLMPDGDSLRVQAEVRSDGRAFHGAGPLEGRNDLAVGVINYVHRCRTPVVLSDLEDVDVFAADPYIQRRATAAIFCCPALQRGTVEAVVYLENDVLPGAFTEDRVEIVRVLTSQLAISIENARLYQQAERLARSFARFVPTAFLALLKKGSVSDIVQGDAVRRDMTVLFADLRAYTTFSEHMSPEENFAFVNQYLSRIGPVVREHGGFIDKYIGDAVMALFPGRAEQAVAASIAIQDELRALNVERGAAGLPPLRTGIGVHFGSLVLGVVGEAERLEGTVISDVVNTASRTERLCKYFDVAVVVTDAVLDQCPDEQRFPRRRLGLVAVAGRAEAVAVHEVFGSDPAPVRAHKQATRVTFEAGVAHLEAGRSREAARCFEAVLAASPDDAAAGAHLERARIGAGPLVAPKE